MRVQVSDLLAKIEAGVGLLGYTETDAATITNVLLYAQLHGNNQILTNLFTGGVPKAASLQPLEVVKQHESSALISGGNPMVATFRAVEVAAQLAEKHGIGMVGLNHTFALAGPLGYFARQISGAGYIGVVCVGTTPLIAPTGSSEPKLGNNPLCYAFPTNTQPVVFETNTVELLEGSSATPKGFGLALLVQMLTGPLSGGSFAGINAEQGTGTFVLAIEPGILVGKEQYLRAADELVQSMATAKPIPDLKVKLPGQQNDEIAKHAIDQNEIDLDDAIWQSLSDFVGNS
jgi:LDH2 family malate/lactate/ureidoglycolate dehydrogenase